MRWQDRAACNGKQHLDWFGESLTFETARLCNDCPVKFDCLMEALARNENEDIGIWGGTTLSQRRAIRAKKTTVEQVWLQAVLV